MTFSLHPRLEADSVLIGNLPLSQLRLHKNAALPWLILIPRQPGLTELHELGDSDRLQIINEISLASSLLNHLYKPDKINVGKLGNIVDQLHIHVIGRFKTDPVWPGPVWGHLLDQPYNTEDLAQRLMQLRNDPLIVNNWLKS